MEYLAFNVKMSIIYKCSHYPNIALTCVPKILS